MWRHHMGETSYTYTLKARLNFWGSWGLAAEHILSSFHPVQQKIMYSASALGVHRAAPVQIPHGDAN